MLKTLPKFFFAIFSFLLYQNLQAQTVLPLNGSASGSITTPGDTSIYSLITNADGEINVTLTVSNNQATYVSLYDSDKVTVLGSPSYTYTGPLTISMDGLAPGKYYVKIYPYYTSGTPGFTVSNTLTVAVPAKDIEPDNTPAQADVLTLNDSTTGHAGYYYNHYRDTTDWFKVTTNADGLLRLRLNVANNTPVYCTLYDKDGVTVLGSNYTYTTEDINTDGLAAGTYYISVYCYYNYQFASYTLSDSLFTPGIGADHEPNNTPAQASVLTLNDSTTGHVGYYYNHYRDTTDWYKVTTTADGLLRLRLNIPNNTPVYCTLYDKDGVTSLGSSYTYNNEDIKTDGLAAGTYYVAVYCYYNGQFAPYTLSDSLFTYNRNDPEPNKFALQAATIPANRTVTGHVGFYYNNIRDTTDWWKINYTGTSGNLNLTFNLVPHIVDGTINPTYFEVYSDTAAAPLYSQYTYTNLAPNLTGLAQGYYYIKVYEYYNSNFEAYSITDSFTQVNKATISIGNAYSSSVSCGSDSIKYNFGASHAPYTVRLYKDGVLFDSTVAATGTASFTGLNDGSYYATVYGDGATDSAYSKTGTTQFLPPTVSGLSTTNITAHTARLNFTAFSCATNYTVQYKVKGTSAYITIPTDSVGIYTLSGLNPSTMYTFRVSSVDSISGLTGNFSDTTNFTTLSSLPVTFINFDGVLNGDRANLTWSTATELNNSGFNVQKSSDGQNFSNIGFVKGNGNSSVVNNYNYTDIKVLSGFNYYRLKQVDIDGNFNYSSIIRLDFSKFDWAVFGNPVTSNSWIQLQVAKTSKVAIQILTVDGRIMKTINKGTLSMGTYSYPLSLDNVPSGIYIVRLITDNGIFSKKIVK